MNPPVEQRTTEGYDLQFGTNVIGMCLRICVRTSADRDIYPYAL